MFVRVAILVVSIFTIGCQSLDLNSVSPKSLKVRKQWVRNTLQKDFYGYRHLHRSTPVIYKKLIIQANAIDGVSAYDRKTGNLKWRKALKGGVVDGLLLANKRLYFAANDGYLYSVNPRNGQTYWSFPVKFEGVGQPVLYNGTIIFQSGNNIVYAVDAKSGQQKWIYTRKILSNISIHGVGRPQVINDKIYVGFSDGYLVALSQSNGQALFERQFNFNKRFKDIDGGLVNESQRIYFSAYDSKLVAIDQSTGKDFWELKEPVSTTPLIDGDSIYAGTTDGRMLKIDKASGKVVWSKTYGKGLPTSPKILKGMLVFGYSKGELVFINKNDGKKVTSFATGRGISSPISIDKETGEIYFMSVDANLYSAKVLRESVWSDWHWM